MRVKTWQILVTFALAVILPIAFVSSLMAQQTESCKGHHRSRIDFYKNIRLLPPANVIEITGNRLNYVVSDQGLTLGSLELEPQYSIVPKDFATDHTGCYGITYCDVHKTVLAVDVLDPKQCGPTE